MLDDQKEVFVHLHDSSNKRDTAKLYNQKEVNLFFQASILEIQQGRLYSVESSNLVDSVYDCH